MPSKAELREKITHLREPKNLPLLITRPLSDGTDVAGIVTITTDTPATNRQRAAGGLVLRDALTGKSAPFEGLRVEATQNPQRRVITFKKPTYTITVSYNGDSEFISDQPTQVTYQEVTANSPVEALNQAPYLLKYHQADDLFATYYNSRIVDPEQPAIAITRDPYAVLDKLMAERYHGGKLSLGEAREIIRAQASDRNVVAHVTLGQITDEIETGSLQGAKLYLMQAARAEAMDESTEALTYLDLVNEIIKNSITLDVTAESKKTYRHGGDTISLTLGEPSVTIRVPNSNDPNERNEYTYKPPDSYSGQRIQAVEPGPGISYNVPVGKLDPIEVQEEFNRLIKPLVPIFLLTK